MMMMMMMVVALVAMRIHSQAMECYGITIKISDPAERFTWGTALFHALIATSFAILFEWGQTIPVPSFQP